MSIRYLICLDFLAPQVFLGICHVGLNRGRAGGERAGGRRLTRDARGFRQDRARPRPGCEAAGMTARTGLDRRGYHRLLAHPFGLDLQRRVLHHGQARSERITHPPGPLLHHVRQLVAQQSLSLGRHRVVLPRCEVEIRAMGEGQGPDFRRLRPDLHPHPGEVGAEEGLHLPLYRLGQTLAGAGGLQHEGARQGEGVAARQGRRRQNGRGERSGEDGAGPGEHGTGVTQDRALGRWPCLHRGRCHRAEGRRGRRRLAAARVTAQEAALDDAARSRPGDAG